MIKARATSVDEYVGKRLRELRIIAGKSQQDIATALKMSYQQIHKYEAGSNRISAGVLYELSCILQVPIKEFFAGYNFEEVTPSVVSLPKEALALAFDYTQINSAVLRHLLRDLLRECARVSRQLDAARGANATVETK